MLDHYDVTYWVGGTLRTEVCAAVEGEDTEADFSAMLAIRHQVDPTLIKIVKVRSR